MAAIKPIPKAVHSSMRSGTVLFDLTRVVEELIYNSLDAGAKKVSVSIGIKTCYVKVVDDGFGISRDGLMLLGEKYATSKMKYLADMDAPSTSFGFRGEALGSVSDVSLLEIITKTRRMPNGYRKIIKGCKCLYFGVDDSREEIGTTVTVRDLYYNQPVRRKQMQNSPRNIMHSVKKCVLRIALVHPKVSFTAVDIESEELLLSTQPSASMLPLLIKNFGAETCECLLEFNDADGMSRLSGYISGPQDTYSPKALQFIYINLRYVGKCLIHKLLNDLASRFPYADASNSRKRNRTQMNPCYILNLTCPRSFYDLSFEPSHTSVEFKDWSSVLTFVERTVMRFWSKMHNGDISTNVAACDEGDPFVPLQLQEVSRTKFRALEDICWIENVKSSEEYLTVEGGQNQDSKCPNIPFPSDIIFNETAEQECAKDFAFNKTCLAWDYDKTTNWSMEDKYECQFPEVDFSYMEVTSQPYNSNLAERERSSVDDSPLLVDEDLFEVRSNSICKSSGMVLCDDNFEFRGDTYSSSCKPYLQSCSTRASTSFDGLSFANSDEDDIFPRQRNHATLEATKDEIIQKSKISGSLWQVNFIIDADSCYSGRIISRYGSLGQCMGLDTVDGITDDCFRMSNCIPKALWQVDPPSDLLNLPCKSMFGADRDYMTQSSEDWVHPVKKLDKSHSDKAGFSAVNCSFDIHTADSVYQHAFGHSTKWSGQPSFEPTSKCKKYVYNDEIMHQGMEDVLVDKYGSVRDNEEKCHKTELEFENCKYVDKDPPKCVEKLYEDDYCFEEYANLFSKDRNSCGMDIRKVNSRSKYSFNEIPSSSSYFDSEDPKMECHADECSRRKRIRSCSAPPFFRSKKKFLALSDYTSKENKSEPKSTIRDSASQEVKVSEDVPQSSCVSHSHSKPNSVDYLFKAGSQMKSKPDKAPDMHGIPKKKLKTSLDDIQTSSFEALSPNKVQVSIDSGTKWRSISQISATEHSKNFHHEKAIDQQDILDISSEILHFYADLLIPESIDKDCLMDAKVLGQVDKKFIPIVGRGILAVIDQHAADERIRLEELRCKVLSGEVRKTSYLNQEQVMELPEVDYQLLHKYSKQIENWGWICNVHAQASDSLTKKMNLLHRSSAKVILIAVPCILGISLSDVDLLEYLQQLADTDGSSIIPPAILRILNSKACRGALMFGDTLLPSECSLLVEELKHTSLCFQCAHGRPTTVPLVNLTALHKQIAKLPTSNGTRPESWHGLSRSQISLDRLQKLVEASQ